MNEISQELLKRLKSEPGKGSVWTAQRPRCSDRAFKLALWLEAETAKNLMLYQWYLLTGEIGASDSAMLSTRELPGVIFDYDRGQTIGKTGRKLSLEEVTPAWRMDTVLSMNDWDISSANKPAPSVEDIDCQNTLNIACALSPLKLDIKSYLESLCSTFSSDCPDNGKVMELKKGRRFCYCLKIPSGHALLRWAKTNGFALYPSVMEYAFEDYAKIIWRYCAFESGACSDTAIELAGKLGAASEIFRDSYKSSISGEDFLDLAVRLKASLPLSAQEKIERELLALNAFLYLYVDIKQPEAGRFLVLCRASISPQTLKGSQYWGPRCQIAREAGSEEEIVQIVEDYASNFPTIYNDAAKDEG